MLLLLKTVAFQDFEEKSKKTSTYFCSELVAAAYQQYGVLDPNVSPSSFSPKDFGEDKLPFVSTDEHLNRTILFDSKLMKNLFAVTSTSSSSSSSPTSSSPSSPPVTPFSSSPTLLK
eukprot:TRINITY_DN808_c0_g1_i1.p1 TRINITY_DN808_c0_g1~~TRINITY_DN808_c0_g1_i1.p1  ORF type:complete len:117 (+),score=53.96 TRINITY_DN808_c0_g1_i1:136-486(+)